MSAVISPCGTYRYFLSRDVADVGLVYAYFGINGSTATATENDQTVKKWIGFTTRNGGRRFIVGNVFGYRATDVKQLQRVADPVGPENSKYLDFIISKADILVPCWGARGKVPPALHHHIDALTGRLASAGKPIKIFGLTKSGDPKHPQMLGYSTLLREWKPQ